ncbi:MAG: CARDB domain-containing protein [Candidatus Thermoplasmatota archaeon]|nr:CARDB domain-containing protein [Candidatus Thermoplasmatota archaeon]
MARGAFAASCVLLMLMSFVVVPASSYDSNGVEASEQSLSILPANPTEGSSVTVSLTLQNTNLQVATNVDYSFYANAISTNTRLYTSTVNIPADDFATVTTTWEGLSVSDDKLYVTYSYNNGPVQEFWKSFTVQGLPSLYIVESTMTPSAGIHSGDTVALDTKIANIGSVDAPASNLGINYPGSMNDVELPTDAILAGSEVWVNTTFIAPSTGSYDIILTPDVNDEILESSDDQVKQSTVPLVVDPRMDLFHDGDLTITPTEGSLIGPWTVSGVLAREAGEGTSTVPMVLEFREGAALIRSTQVFDVQISGTGYSTQPWTSSITSTDIAGLPTGGYTLAAVIDPFGSGTFTQEHTDNDELLATFSLPEIPDVFIDPLALPSRTTVAAGDYVDWSITATNTGDVAVSGKFVYTWEGQSFDTSLIPLNPGQVYTHTISHSTDIGQHTAELYAEWQPSSGSYDRDPTNSVATGEVLVEANLQLDWDGDSMTIVDEAGEAATFPLESGQQYTMSLDVRATRGTGDLTFTCKNSQTTWGTTDVTIANPGDRTEVSCTFTASGKMSIVQLVPSDAMVADTFERSFSTALVDGDGSNSGNNDGTGTAVLLFVGALVMIGVLVGAVLLTREREEEVERDIFNYCPACDGELEGDENRCPHCSFNLRKARSQFHDCHECGESIPDLMENCAYCGAEQDVSSFFERRVRRIREVPEEKQLVTLPEENEDEIVTGSENFADAVKEFGYDESHLEDEWDENVVAAEQEVTAAYDIRNADEIAMEDMTDEEIEAMQNQVVTTLKTVEESFEGHDLDAFLPTKENMKTLKDDGEDKDGAAWTTLSASDAEIRGDLYDLTGEEGVMPGEKVVVGMGITDNSLAGNEIKEASADFAFEDDSELPLTVEDGDKTATKPRRRPRRNREPEAETADCGACGAVIPADAKECPTCGAKFE